MYKVTHPSRGLDASPRSTSPFAKNFTRRSGRFDRDRLPDPLDYFLHEELKLNGSGGWKSARCPFHDDSKPSLRVRVATGGFAAWFAERTAATCSPFTCCATA